MLTITRDTGITLGAAALILSATISCTLYVVRTIDTLNIEVTNLKKDSYTISQAAEASLRLAIMNPGMRVPDPRNPGMIIMVEK